MRKRANRSRSIRQIARRELFLQIWSLDLKRSFRARFGGTMLTRSRCKPAEIICRPCARSSNNANAGSGVDKRRLSVPRSHPERRATESKDPAKSRNVFITGFLDFARNDDALK